MSLHLFKPPTPAPPSSGERVSTLGRQGKTSASNPHTEEMRRSIIAARVANILHLAACELYGTDQRLFEALRSGEKAIVITIANDALIELKPEKCWHCGAWLPHDRDDFCSTQCRLAQERG